MVPKKRGFYSDDLWNIVYLPKFKWENLTEKLAYDERIRKEKIKTEISQEKKKQDFYMEKLDLSKKVMGMEKRKKRKLENSENKDINLMMRQFKQHQSVHNLFKDEENE